MQPTWPIGHTNKSALCWTEMNTSKINTLEMHWLWHGYGPVFGLPSIAQTNVFSQCVYYPNTLYLAIDIAGEIKLYINMSFLKSILSSITSNHIFGWTALSSPFNEWSIYHIIIISYSWTLSKVSWRERKKKSLI